MTRRALLGATGAALGLGAVATGCETTGRPAVAGRSATPVEVPPDVRSATDALGAVGLLRDQVTATTARFPGLRPSLDRVAAMHRAHYDALAGAVPKGAAGPARPSAPPVPARRKAALRRLAAQELALHRQLVGLAQRAESGTFARMLASMAAAVDQRLAEWPS